MDNNKNNSANVAEESKNNTMLYAGIGIVVVILLIGFGYWMWGGSAKESDDSNNEEPKTKEQIAQEVRVIFKYGFVSEEQGKSIKEYNNIETSKTAEKEASKKKLEKHLGDKKPEKIKEAYTKHAKKIKELQDKMAKIIKGLDHEKAKADKDKVVTSLENFTVPENSSDQMDGSNKRAVEKYIKEAIKKINAMKTEKNKKDAVTYIGKGHDSNSYYCTHHLRGKAQEEMIEIGKALNEIDVTALATTPEESPNLEELAKAKKEWDEEDYQAIVDEYRIAEALGQISTEGN